MWGPSAGFRNQNISVPKKPKVADGQVTETADGQRAETADGQRRETADGQKKRNLSTT